jgi:hypothetical protein
MIRFPSLKRILSTSRLPQARSFQHTNRMGAEQSTIIDTPEMNLALTKCRIVVVGPRNYEDALSELVHLPKEARIIGTGSTIEELRQDGDLFSEVCLNFLYF